MPKVTLLGIGLLVCEVPMECDKCNYFDASADQQVASKKEKKRKKEELVLCQLTSSYMWCILTTYVSTLFPDVDLIPLTDGVLWWPSGRVLN